MSGLILAVNDLKVHFPIEKAGLFRKQIRSVKAVDGVDFEVHRGETLGIVGESGCGKSTLARAILRLVPVTSGNVVWLGEDLSAISDKKMREKRKEMQLIFQDPLASLNPRMNVGQIIGEPLRIFNPELSKTEVKERIKTIMQQVGLMPEHINRYPHEFSGGQCQRIGIARTLILQPKLIICDEPVSALDVSIQAQIINLLMKLQKELDLALIFIAHDLSVVKHISDRVMVMYLGRIVEMGDRDSLYNNPQHPYTQALLSAVPIPDPQLERSKKVTLLQGDIPSPLNPPSGCSFRTRCPYATALCAEQRPPLHSTEASHEVACHYVGGKLSEHVAPLDKIAVAC